eukprot:PITA_08768
MEDEGTQVWDMFFDESCSKEIVGARVVLVSPKQESTHLSFKLTFQVTNNIAEYEVLLLGLNATKDMGIRDIKVFGDANLIIQQVAQKEDQAAVHRHYIGSPDNRKYIKLSTHLSVAQSAEYYTLMKQFANVFHWEYNDLKTYDKKIIQHKIPLEKDTISFK